MNKNAKIFPLVLMGITAIVITVGGIIMKQSFWRILPLYISLIVAYLNSRVDRKAFLIGGLNSVLYAVVYISFGLYSSAGFALLVSFPFQIWTFIRWNKRPYENSTIFQRLSAKKRALISVAFIICWILLNLVSSLLGANYALIDNTLTLVGILATVLAVFPYIEYIWLNLVSAIISLILYAVMIRENPEQITYLAYSVYALICISLSVVNSQRLYKAQQKQSE